MYPQAISSKSSSDTSDDFIEGLRHFDKVITWMIYLEWLMLIDLYWPIPLSINIDWY
jgi:hypothetical protein